jgi:predicted helicase
MPTKSDLRKLYTTYKDFRDVSLTYYIDTTIAEIIHRATKGETMYRMFLFGFIHHEGHCEKFIDGVKKKFPDIDVTDMVKHSGGIDYTFSWKD